MAPRKMVRKRAFGSSIGRALGQIGGALMPIPGVSGGDLGAFLGSMMPFRRGGAPRRAVKRKARGGRK